MSNQELRDLVASLATSQAKTDEQLRKTDEQLRKTDEQLKESERLRRESEEDFNRRIKKLEKLVGNIGNNQGDVAEEYFINSLKEKLKIAHIDFDYLIPNYVIEGKGVRDEFDILLVNGSSVAIVEVKYKVHPGDLEALPRKIENLKRLPQYKDYAIYAGIAGFYVPNDVIEEAKKRGFFVLQRKGDVIQSYADHLTVA